MTIESAYVGERRDTTNLLARGLPADVWRELRACAERVSMQRGRTLHDLGVPIEYVYLLESGFVTMKVRMKDAPAVEFVSVGNEGVVGLPVLLGVRHAVLKTAVSGAGTALRVAVADFARVAQHPSMKTALQLYATALFAEISRDAVCSRCHGVRERCARQLLVIHERVAERELALTQQHLANLLGVGRVSVGVAAKELRELGCIDYARGSITIRDRGRLEAVACACYAEVRRHYWRLGMPQS